jgi:hypothetical protein
VDVYHTLPLLMLYLLCLLSCCSCILWVPIDVVKERMQIQRVPLAVPGAATAAVESSFVYRNSWHALTTIVKTEGFKSIYKVCVGLRGAESTFCNDIIRLITVRCHRLIILLSSSYHC